MLKKVKRILKMAMFDVNALESEVQAELAAERAEAAKGLLKAKLAQIAKAEKVVQTLKMEYKELLTDIALEA
ncbi:hypothetical protein UFOVP447_239 [uncultured Caudovirales phage]|uniref:Uncharacterized protein n=1 Tax=uncultured Caudovirales phage TaxID=2100421 RepID=A0A6J5MFE5_9CAUD|nr:hypothetical protein UFOVP447_239 [uncultured Caudovirales phage]